MRGASAARRGRTSWSPSRSGPTRSCSGTASPWPRRPGSTRSGAGDVGPDHRGGPGQDKTVGVQGTTAEALHRVDQRAGRVRPAARSSRTPRRRRRTLELGLDRRAGEEAADGHRHDRPRRRRWPGLSDRRTRTRRRRSSRATTAAFMVNWPFVWSAARASVEDGTFDQSVARRHRLGAVPAGHRGAAERARRTAASTSASAPSATYPTSPTRRPSASSLRGAPGAVLRRRTATRPSTRVGLRRPRGQRGVPDGGRSSGSRSSGRAPAADAVLQRGAPPACSRRGTRRRGRPGRHAGERRRPDHRRAQGEQLL